MTTEDDKIRRRYRELAREEPPREVDEAILAAARRAADARPAPLVVPTGRRRWYFPLAAAAIIVLAVAVTMHVERQRPDLEIAEAPVTAPPQTREEQAGRMSAPAEPVPAAPQPKALAKRELYARDPKPAPSQELRARRDAADQLADLQKTQKPPAAPAPPPAAAPATPAAPEPAARDAASEMREAPGKRAALQSRAEVTVGAVSGPAASSPEQWLQGIADLRRQGRHEEADKALAEFRRTYPGYRISEAMLEKVEKKP